MKKYILIGSLFTLFLLLINIFDILGFFYNQKGYKEFNEGKYQDAYENFKTSDQISSSATKKYNIANTYYKQKDNENALKFYNYALSSNLNCEKSPEFCFLNYHNIGNTYYRLGQKYDDINQKLSLRNQSIDSYQKALKLKYDQETKENLEFVQKQIDELKNQQNQEQENQQNSQQQSGSGDSDPNSGQPNGTGYQENQTGSNESTQQNTSGNNQSGENEATNGQTGQYGNNENLDQQTTKLTQEQTKELKNYLEYLKQEELNNQQYFNKKYQNSDQNDIFSQFFGSDPFFDNGALNNNGEKDW